MRWRAGIADELHAAAEPDREELVELMYRDKKVERGKLRFVLPARLGHVELVRDVKNADVVAAMDS